MIDGTVQPGQVFGFDGDANSESVVVIVNNIEVHITRTDEGVSVDLWPLGSGFDTLGSTWALFAEAAENQHKGDQELEEEA